MHNIPLTTQTTFRQPASEPLFIDAQHSARYTDNILCKNFFFIEKREHPPPLPPTSDEENNYICSRIVSSCEGTLAYFRCNSILFFIDSWGTFLSILHKVLSNTEYTQPAEISARKIFASTTKLFKMIIKNIKKHFKQF